MTAKDKAPVELLTFSRSFGRKGAYMEPHSMVMN